MPFEARDLDKMMGDPWRCEVPPFCPKCHRVLSGTGANRCPECGVTYVRSEVHAHAEAVQTELRRMSNMNRLVTLGLKFAAVGGAALALGLVRAEHSPALNEFGRLVAVICGLPAMSLGLNVFRVKRLPQLAIQCLPETPRFGLGMLTGMLGAGLLVLSVLIP